MLLTPVMVRLHSTLSGVQDRGAKGAMKAEEDVKWSEEADFEARHRRNEQGISLAGPHPASYEV